MNDSESATSSVVSGDSLDQFCRDADFGSLNNLSSESTVQTVVTECRNEQDEVKEKEEKDEEKSKDEERKKTGGEEVANTDYEGNGILSSPLLSSPLLSSPLLSSPCI